MSKTNRFLLAAAVALALGAASAPLREPDALPPVVSTDALADALGTPGLVTIDARSSIRDFLAGHLPGAQPLAPDNLRSVSLGVPGQIWPQEVLRVAAGRIGLTAGSRIVVYGAATDPDAAYVASVLELAGARDVAILDGGFERWTAEARAVTKDRPRVEATRPSLEPDRTALADLDAVRRAIEKKSAVLVDARPRDAYDSGHLPGAVSHYWKDDVVPEGEPRAGLLRPAAELERAYAALGVTRDRPAIVYCNTGHQASLVYWILRRVLKHPDVRLYNGSFVEWSAHPELPVEKSGAAAGADRARKAADALASALMSRLQAALKAGGPASALGVCAEVAPAIAAEQSRNGVAVHRVSLKARNVIDTPDPWEREHLLKLETDAANGKELPKEIVETVARDGRREVRYLRPIFIVPTCLSCHGPRDAMEPAVLDILDALYPTDTATEYQSGDLRGAISARVPLE